ncbi:WD40 repeat protein [Breznakibacter xylanolyticus]|uniref:WD40 repeat protein n=1 Tax=Breznakibacter xylanolyticus TaxID=990 RepID=A0A2W7MZ31_9BACT|nr:OmpA family protein [Breznakibacter xylanolyticus]PZX13070.1 WD40 repeat protein [Breznakibacter xylanolyticus]
MAVLFLVPLLMGAQKSELKKAEGFYKNGEYFKALENYNASQKLGETFDLETRKKVARCYYYLNNIDKAFETFTELADDLSGNDVLLYAITAHKVGFYEGAIELFEKAKIEGANPVQVNEMIKSCQWALENSDFLPVLVNPTTAMTFGQSFGINYYEKGVVYSSALEGAGSKNVDKMGRPFMNLYYSDLKDGQIQETKRLFSEKLVFPFHVGATAFTSDYKMLFFTRAVRVKGGKDVMKIFSVKYDGKDWGNITELYINSDDYDCAHPAISPDNKVLYFVSNRRGGFGGKDLYSVELKNNNTFGEPKNLGKDINTYGDEVYPVVSKDNKLYFSSDGHYGFGGWDIFMADFINGKWTNVTNMRQPYNSTADDFGYIIDPSNSQWGFLSSNRAGDRIDDVIFYVRPREVEKVEDEKRPIAGLENLKPVEEPVEPMTPPVVPPIVDTVQEVIVATPALPNAFASVLKNSSNNEAVAGASVLLKDPVSGAIIGQAYSNADGSFNVPIPVAYQKQDQEFDLIVSKGNEFREKQMIVNIQEFDDIKKNGIILTPIFNDAVLDDISLMVIPYVGEEITAEGLAVIEKLSAYMTQNPNIVVKLNGHTDARGNRYTNLDVSQRVAEKCEQILMGKGIADDNMIPRSYAERYLVNKCRRGVYCDNETHLQNRRIEVVVWRKKN